MYLLTKHSVLKLQMAVQRNDPFLVNGSKFSGKLIYDDMTGIASSAMNININAFEASCMEGQRIRGQCMYAYDQ